MENKKQNKIENEKRKKESETEQLPIYVTCNFSYRKLCSFNLLIYQYNIEVLFTPLSTFFPPSLCLKWIIKDILSI